MYMLTAARILDIQTWKATSMPMMEERWMEEVRELAEMEKIIVSVREKNRSSWVSTWKPFLGFMLEAEKKMKLELGFAN